MKGIQNCEQVNEEYGIKLSEDEFKDVLVPAWLSVIDGKPQTPMTDDEFVKWFKKSKTNLNNLPTGRFKEVDIRNFKQLNIQGKKVSLLSPAPSSSYSLLKEGSGYKLVINDPTSFWSISNYLVIQAD